MNPTLKRIILNRTEYPLDIVPNAVLALGTTRLSKNYTGPLARMRESVASAEGDVGSDQNRNLNGSQWGPLVNGADAYESVMYDQCGNALQATQTTAANQPMIVMSGNLLDGVKFDDVNDSLVVAKTPVINDITNLSVMWVGKFNGAGGGGLGRIFDKTGSSTNGRYVSMNATYMYIAFAQYFASGSITWHAPNNSVVYNKNYCIIKTYNNSSASNEPLIYINGIPQTLIKVDEGSSGTPVSDAAQDLYIGNRSAGDRVGNLTTKDFIMANGLWTPNEVLRLTQNAFKRYGFTA